MEKNEIIEALKLKGITCNSCWWREGYRCYVEPCEREDDGRSKKMANEVCEQHTSKRSVLGSIFPPNMLTITSEETDKAKGGDGINY